MTTMSAIKKGLAVLLAITLVLTGVPLAKNHAEASTSISQLAHNRLHQTVALYIGSHRAIAGNKFTQIDPLSTLTKPIIQNARTLVPVRFIAENFGATVGWDDATLTVPITLGDTTVVLKIGSKTMMLNGKAVTLDVTPIIHNKRTFVPLRAITEAFGKHVFYDRELIVVSDQPVLDAVVDKGLVDETIAWFKTGKMPVWQNPMLTLQQLSALDKSVVMVLAYDADGEVIGQGSGFSLGNGLFATSLHVLLDAYSFKIMDHTRTLHDIKGVVNYNYDMDLAILCTPTSSAIPALPMGSQASVKKGDQIVTIGSPFGLLNTISTGTVSNIHTEDYVTLFQISAPIAPGSSGGVLLDMYGQAIGITFMGIEGTDLNFVIPIDYIFGSHQPVKNIDVSDIEVFNLPLFSIYEPPVYRISATKQVLVDIRDPGNVTMHPTEPIMYIADRKLRAVIAVNYETGVIERIEFELSPERMIVRDGELLVGLLSPDRGIVWDPDFKGSIAIIDIATFSTKQVMQLDLGPWYIDADDDYLYVTSADGHPYQFVSYSRATGERVSAVDIAGMGFIQKNPHKDEFYLLTGTTIQTVPCVDGVLGPVGSSTKVYGGNNMTLSPDGELLIFCQGTVLKPDLTQTATLVNGTVAFDLENDELFVFYHSNSVYVYEYSTLKHIYTLEIDGQGLGYFFFYQNDKLISLDHQRKNITIYSLN